MTKKKLMMMVAAVVAAFGAWAATETVGDYTWTYRINGDTAEISGVSPSTGSVTIPSALGGKPVTSIGDDAFYNCNGLTNVTIPDSVTSIGSGAFCYCSGLTSVTIGNGVTSIGDYAFAWCSGLTAFAVGSGNPSYKAVSGLLLTKDGKTLVAGVNGNVTIPDSVTSIGDSAFSGCRGLTSVTIPDSVTSIGSYAFRGCSGLTNVTIGSSVTSIGVSAFYNCSGLTSIAIPNSVTNITDNAFYNCCNLTSVTIPDSVTNIADYAFYNCSNLTSVTIPGSVTSIGSKAFKGCDGIKSVNVSQCILDRTLKSIFPSYQSITNVEYSGVITNIGARVFCDCCSLKSVSIPDSVTSIGTNAFYGCASLTSVTIPASTKRILYCAFEECSSLTAVYIHDLSAWCETMFQTQTSNPLFYAKDLYLNGKLVVDLTVPEGIMSVAWFAFQDCTSLKSVTIPDGVESIGSMAFYGCSSITNVTISKSVTSIQSGAFMACSSLESVTIPDGVTNIPAYAFAGCSGLTNVLIPSSVTNFGYYAFYGCTNVINLSASFVPEGLDSCKLTKVSIPNCVTKTNIEYSAFAGCTNVTTLVASFVPRGMDRGKLMSVAIPDGVTTVESYAFSGCSGLTNVTISDSVTNIGYSAFSGCSGLEEITLPFVGRQRGITASASSLFGYIFGSSPYAGGTQTCQYYGNRSDKSSIYYIPSSLKKVVVTEETALEFGAFYDCRGLTSVMIPDSVTSIGDCAFYDCRGLTSVTIPDSVTSIGISAFEGCMGLTSVAIGNSVTSIGEDAFKACCKLTSVAIPDSVIDIGGEAFDYCGSLAEVRMPVKLYGRVTSGEPIFPNCSDGLEITYYGSVNVLFDANGGMGGLDCTLNCGDDLVAPDVRRTDYTHVGWAPEVPDKVPPTNSIYKARWRANQYMVTFDANGGTGGRSAKQNYGSTIVPPTVTKEWCDFAGWLPAVDAKVPAHDVAYTAQWRRWGDRISNEKLGGKTMMELYPQDYAHMTDVILEEGIAELPEGFFDGCDNVVRVSFPDSLETLGYDDLPARIRATLAYDASGFMIYCGWVLGYADSGATELVVPETAHGIGTRAFDKFYDLQTVEVPRNIGKIGRESFRDCTYLDNVEIPDSVSIIGAGAFEGCSYMQAISIGSGVRKIGNRAFARCANLQAVVLPSGVESVGAEAFWNDWRMLSVSIPHSVTNVGVSAFGACKNLTGVTVPATVGTMTYLFPDAYSNKIDTVTVAAGETGIMDNMFKGCKKLVNFNWCGTETNVGAYAFSGCGSLQEVVVPHSVTQMGEGVFKGCKYLREVSLSHNLGEIPDSAFSGCSALDSLIIPSAVTNLGSGFFDPATLSIYYLGSSAPDCHSSAYSGAASGCVSYVIQGSRGWDGPGSRVLPELWNNHAITYWTPNQFDTTFDANGGRFDVSGGSTWSEQQITDTGYALPSTEPVRPGWAFDGWWTEPANGAQIKISTRVTLTREHTIYAHWRYLGERMTVSFNANGGTAVVPETQNYVPGQTFGNFPVPTRRGYIFQDWWTEAVNGIRMTEATVVPAADMELFAHWLPITYYVRFNANGGTGTMTNQVFRYNVAQNLKTHTFERKGFAFSGWATTPSGQVRYAENARIVNLEEVQGEVVDLYAVWSGAGYSVRFDSNGGKGFMDNQTIAIGETQNLWPNVYTRQGYVFAGWAVSPTDAETGKVSYRDGAEVKDLATENAATVPLYAVWEEADNTVRISFDANGGSVSPGHWDCVRGTTVEAFPTPTRPGFTFAGWWTETNGGVIVDRIESVSSSSTYYAHWTENGTVIPGPGACVVAFDANGGSVSPLTRTVSSGSSLGEFPVPVRIGYTFAGWFTAVDGGAAVTAETEVTADVTYYAHWTLNVEPEPTPEPTPEPEPEPTPTPTPTPEPGPEPTPEPTPTPTPTPIPEPTPEPEPEPEPTPTPTPEPGPEPTPEPVVVPELYEVVDGATPVTAASVYEGYLYNKTTGAPVGTIQVKVGKAKLDKKTQSLTAAVKATVVIGATKKSLKGADKGKAVLSSDGPTELELVGGEACEVVLGAEGLSGSYGSYLIDGARNFFASKVKGEQGVANDVLSKWLGPVSVVWNGGSVNVSIAKKGKAKVKGTLANGTKVSAKSVFLVGEEWCAVPVAAPKAKLTFTLWLLRDGRTAVVEGLGDGAIAGKPRALKSSAKFQVGKTAALWTSISGTVLTDYIPDGFRVASNGGKWVLPKAGKVVYKDGAVDGAKLGENPSALKLSYKAKDGSFKGSFKVYAVIGGKLKATTVNVTGVVINGVGYGTATIKKVGSVPVKVE